MQGKAHQRVRFVQGSVMGTGLGANQFDVAYARFLFQHLPDPSGAASEIRRVLKPGGTLIVKDIDDAIFSLFEPPIPELALVTEKFGEAQGARGGNRQIGRRLWRLLDAAGFGKLDLEIVANYSGTVGAEPFLQQLAPGRLLPLVQQGLLPEQHIEHVRASRTQFSTAPDAYTL